MTEQPNPQHLLASIFGYEEFRGNQKEIIDGLIAGQSALVLMPTGSGKSLCYQIPALCRTGVGIVVSPLIALMNDQVMALQQLGVRAACLHSGLTPQDKRMTYDRMREGTLDLLYIAPERLVSEEFLDLLDRTELALFAIDEAHCISQWGHDFRPEYQDLSCLRTRYPNVPCLAVTATADQATRLEIQERLSLPHMHVAGFDRPNITYHVGIKNNPRAQLIQFLKSRDPGESGIIYCLSRRKVEDTAAYLADQGYTALPYHAGLSHQVREDHQTRFLNEDGVIIVATIAFGMGINKPDVRFVAHMDLPKNIEAYYQETGRAGRDGQPSSAWMVYGLQDVALQRQMIENGESQEVQKRIERQKLNAFLGFCETATCRRQVLLRYFGDDCEPCHNCDICISPPKTMDGTVAAQKILSCVYRTGQMFGAGYIIDVLLGSDDERIRKFGHDRLSTYGIGEEHSRKEWQSFIRQLIAGDLLYADMDHHGGLKITESGTAFLKDKQSIQLRLDVASKPARVTKTPKASIILETAEQESLFEQLKALRLDLAKKQKVPPYVIFHDKTLLEMTTAKPTTEDEMSHISGVGQSKLTQYGTLFLDVIRAA